MTNRDQLPPLNIPRIDLQSKRPIAPLAEEILGLYFPVLDHGFVSLVDYMGNDLAIEEAARTSYQGGNKKSKDGVGLLRLLKRHTHTTPFEMVELKFHCSMPIFIARQWIRHRTASVNEMSGRYSILPMKFYMPKAEQLRQQSTLNKQGRGERELPIAAEAQERWKQQRSMAADNYEWLTENDLARELARIDLPLSTYTNWYWKIDLHNLMHFLRLRVDAHAQFEFREYGNVIAAMMARVAPIAYQAWLDYDVGGVRLSYAEIELLRKLVAVEDAGEKVSPGHVDVWAKDGAGSPRCVELFTTKRERDEFVEKMKPRPLPAFSIEPGMAVPYTTFEEDSAG